MKKLKLSWKKRFLILKKINIGDENEDPYNDFGYSGYKRSNTEESKQFYKNPNDENIRQISEEPENRPSSLLNTKNFTRPSIKMDAITTSQLGQENPEEIEYNYETDGQNMYDENEISSNKLLES